MKDRKDYKSMSFWASFGTTFVPVLATKMLIFHVGDEKEMEK